MPQVRTYGDGSPEVQAQMAPSVRLRAPEALSQLGEGGRELQQLGTSMQQMGSALGHYQASVNTNAVKDQDTALANALLAVQHGSPESGGSPAQPGYLSTVGENAVNNRDNVLQQMQDIKQKYADGLSSDRQREMFEQVASQRLAAAAAQVNDHADRQKAVWSETSSISRRDMGIQTSAANFNPSVNKAIPDVSKRSDAPSSGAVSTPTSSDQLGAGAKPTNQDQKPADPYTLGWQTAMNESMSIAAGKGLRPGTDEFNQAVKEQMQPLYANTVSKLIADNNIGAARQYFDAVKGELDIKTADHLQGLLQTGSNKNDALSIALEVKSKISSIGAQEKELDTRFKNGAINAETHELALQKLRADNAQRRGEEAEQTKSFLGAIWDAKLKNPNMALANLSTGQLRHIKQNNLGPTVESILKNDGVTDDFALFNDLSRMAAEKPAEFAGTDLVKLSGQLSKPHRDHLLSLQTSISKGDAKEIEANRLVQSTIKTVNADMLNSGLVKNPKPDSNDAKNLASFNAQLHDAIVNRQQISDRPLTPEDARKIALGLLHSVSITGHVWDTQKPAYLLTPEERAKPLTISDQDRIDITAALKAKRKPVTEENIQALYKMNKGI